MNPSCIQCGERATVRDETDENKIYCDALCQKEYHRLLLSGKQKKEKKEDKKKTTRDGKIKKRDGTERSALEKAMGTTDYITYNRMLQNFQTQRQEYQANRFLVTLLEELMKLRAEIISFLASVVIKLFLSEQDDEGKLIEKTHTKRKLVEKTRQQFEMDTNSIDRLLG
jgi:dGTP triphosphohydrolase